MFKASLKPMTKRQLQEMRRKAQEMLDNPDWPEEIEEIEYSDEDSLAIQIYLEHLDMTMQELKIDFATAILNPPVSLRSKSIPRSLLEL